MQGPCTLGKVIKHNYKFKKDDVAYRDIKQ